MKDSLEGLDSSFAVERKPMWGLINIDNAIRRTGKRNKRKTASEKHGTSTYMSWKCHKERRNK